MRRWVAICAMLILASCGSRDDREQRSPPQPQVRIVRAGASHGASVVSGVGTVALRRETQLGFTSPGRIARLSVNEGDIVRRGQVLAALDTTTVAATMAGAVAERDRAIADFRRSETLLKQGWVTQPRVESARAAMLASEAQARAAGFQEANAVITAPGPGTVLARLAEPGQVVPVGTPVLVIGEQASGWVLKVPLSDRDAARVSVGAPAEVMVSVLEDAPIAGRVIEVAGRADRATGTFVVQVALPADTRLRSGQIGEARIVARGAGAMALILPATAVFAPRAGVAFVYVVDPATRHAHVRKIGIGETDDAGIHVTTGLSPNDWVAVSRVDRLTDGMAIDPVRISR